MPAYVVVNVEVQDPERFEAYRAQAPAVIAQYGGRYLVRGGEVHPVEGSFGFKRLVILEFPSVEAARRFYDSPEYAPLLKLRQEAARSDMVLVEGVAPPA
jgi:uncharacterized protein (DUF1330 family)